MQDLDLTVLRTFVAVAEHQSMTRAGTALHLTQGAVSQHIARLERDLGTELLVRHRRGVELTVAGERLLGRAQTLLRLNDEAWADLSGGPPRRNVRIGMPVDCAQLFSRPSLREFAAEHPEVHLSIECGASLRLREGLTSGTLDLAVLQVPQDEADDRYLLGTDQLVWAGAADGTAHRRRPLPLALVSGGCVFRPIVLDALRAAGLDWTPYDATTYEAALAAVRMDAAVTASLSTCVPPDLQPVTGLPVLSPIAVEVRTRSRTPSSIERLLVEAIRGCFDAG